MRVKKLKNFKRGWVIGNFKPSIKKIKNLEICFAYHKKNEKTYPHYHTKSTEYNVILQGSLFASGKKLKKGDIFIYKKNEVSNVDFLKDTILAIIRMPSAPKDKVFLKRPI